MPPPPSDDDAREVTRQLARKGESDTFAALALVIAGPLFWGGVGFALSTWLHNTVYVAVGLLMGMAGGLYLVWLRYGRAQ